MRISVVAALAAGCVFVCSACAAPADSVSSNAAAEVPTVSSSAESAAVDGPFTSFSAATIHGDDISQTVFADRDLTLVNLMATWCSPCIAEMPELEELYTEGSVGVIGVVIDTASGGTVDEEAVETAQYIEERLGITYPLIIPDPSGFDGLVATIQAVPTTYFVRSDGSVAAGPFEGSRTLAAWKELAEQTTENAQ